MLQKLERYYDTNGILSTRFCCSFKKQCSCDCDTFTGPKSAFVSSGYEAHSLPRLLFLSLDSGSGAEQDEDRLPGFVRKQEEIDRDVLILPKHKHWYRTHELAWYILRQFEPDLRIEDARRYFAHANSAKCCMNNPHRRKANAILFRNCRVYLKGELSILSPEIVVTQGSEAKAGIESIREETIQRFNEFSSIILFEGCEVFWLHTYHPSNWGAFNKQRDFDKVSNTARGWVRYATMIHNFLTTSTRTQSGQQWSQVNLKPPSLSPRDTGRLF